MGLQGGHRRAGLRGRRERPHLLARTTEQARHRGVNALSVEAFNRTNPGYEGATPRLDRYVPPEHGTPDTSSSDTHVSPDRRQPLMSDFALLNTGPDPTGRIASRSVDGDLDVGTVLALDLDVGQHIVRLLGLGLTDGEIEVYLLKQAGMAHREIAGRDQEEPGRVVTKRLKSVKEKLGLGCNKPRTPALL